MGMFDGLVGSVLGKVTGEKAGMAQVAMEMFNTNGGVGGILEKFKTGGLADAAASWVGMGDNIPVSADQISSVLGNDQIAAMAEKFGIDPATLSAQIAEYLPSVVDKMTPNGAVEADSGNTLSSVLGMFK